MINIIVNIKSGKGKARRSLKRIVGFLINHGIDYSLFLTKKKGHATEITQTLTKNGGTIVAVGGDGTFHEVLNGIVDVENTKVGFIPCGRGNDFTRAAKFSSNPIRALKDIVYGSTQPIDFIKIGDLRCLNVAGTGLDVKVLEITENSSNKLTYLASLIQCLTHFDPYHIKLTTPDGNTIEKDCIMIGVCNGNCFGGNMKISPLSKIDDGLLDVVLIEMPKDQKIMKILPKFLKGKHLGMSFTTHFTCTSIQIDAPYPIQLDGEIYRDAPFNCEIVQGGLNVFMPNKY